MELKTYQKKVLADLDRYLTCLHDTEDLRKAYEQYWNDKDVSVGFGGAPAYQNNIEGTPHICFKVPGCYPLGGFLQKRGFESTASINTSRPYRRENEI